MRKDACTHLLNNTPHPLQAPGQNLFCPPTRKNAGTMLLHRVVTSKVNRLLHNTTIAALKFTPRHTDVTQNKESVCVTDLIFNKLKL